MFFKLFLTFPKLFQNTQVRSMMQQEADEADTDHPMTSSSDLVMSRKLSKIRREEKLSQTNLSSPLDRPSSTGLHFNIF